MADEINCGGQACLMSLLAMAPREYTQGMKPFAVSCNPAIMGAAPVFSGTRVPVQTLLNYLEAGESIDEFLAGFPSVTREPVIAFLEQAKDRLVESVS